ncbi:UPF0179 family protein [[Eubacterium] cellulosolvens]
MSKGFVTIIGSKQARKGYRFIFDGLARPCLTCDYQNACVGNLEVGRVYMVQKVMKKTLQCRLHEGEGRVVEVIESLYDVNIRSQAAMLDVVLRFELIDCTRVGCPEYEECRPVGLQAGDRCRVVKVERAISCPVGLKLTSVQLKREPRLS